MRWKKTQLLCISCGFCVSFGVFLRLNKQEILIGCIQRNESMFKHTSQLTWENDSISTGTVANYAYCVASFNDSFAEKSMKMVFALKKTSIGIESGRSSSFSSVSSSECASGVHSYKVYLLYYHWILNQCNVRLFFNFKNLDFHSICKNNYT